MEDLIVENPDLVLVQIQPLQVPESKEHVLGEIRDTVPEQIQLPETVQVAEGTTFDPGDVVPVQEQLFQIFHPRERVHQQLLEQVLTERDFLEVGQMGDGLDLKSSNVVSFELEHAQFRQVGHAVGLEDPQVGLLDGEGPQRRHLLEAVRRDVIQLLLLGHAVQLQVDQVLDLAQGLPNLGVGTDLVGNVAHNVRVSVFGVAGAVDTGIGFIADAVLVRL